MADNREKLFDMFPECSYDQWRAKVEADLKGADFNKKLVWRTNEGFNVEPVYRAENIADFKTTDTLPGEYPYLRGTRTNNDWKVRQEILDETIEAANATALDVIQKGVNSLGFNIALANADEVGRLLNGIDLTKVEINFKSCPRHAVELANALVEYLRQNGKLTSFHGSIDFNPMRRALKHGQPFPGDIKATALELLEVAKVVDDLQIFAVDSHVLSDAGAYIYQELGYALAWGAQWMTMLTDAGVKADIVAKRIKFNMGVSSNYFMEIAKFRAARMLWAQIVEQYKPDSKQSSKMLVHAITSRFNQTIYDAHVNLLRSQTESMSAALAGVDSITTTPFDVPYKKPDAFSERIARNQQHLLKEESHLDKVIDPAGGSYYVETLTLSIAQQAWKLFLEVEEKGGFLACINDGSVQEAVNASNEKRHTDVARRKEILLGTNQYPNINETAASKIEYSGEGCGCKHGDHGQCENNGGLNMSRAASDFETLRLATEAAAKRPKVFMLTIGNLAMRLARAQFSTNFFGCAGYEIIDNLGFETVQQGVDAAIEKNADVVVLCSSDDEYADFAPQAQKALAGRAILVVAGAPACMDELKAQGINDFIHVRCNVLDTLRDFNSRLLK